MSALNATGGRRAARSSRPAGLSFDSAYEVGPGGARLPPADAARPGRPVVQIAAVLDLALGVGSVFAGYLDPRFDAKPFGQFLFLAALWIALALRVGAMNAFALRVRRDVGLVGFVLLTALLATATDRSVATLLWRFVPLADLVFLFGAYAAHHALVLRERETCAAHPSWQSCVPVRAPWTRRSLVVFSAGVEWIVCGAIDAFLRNLWFGQTVAAFGVLAVIFARQLAPTHTDARIPVIDRPRAAPWWIYPVGAPLLAFRVVWILTHVR